MESSQPPFLLAPEGLTCVRCSAFGITSAIQPGKSLRRLCGPAKVRLSSVDSANNSNRSFRKGSKSFSAGTAAALAKTYDFGRHQRVLDVGGGTGSFLLAILQHHKNLTGTLFELPGACAVARQRLAKTPEASRIKVVEGSFLKDPLPGGHDVLVVANTVHVLSAAHNMKLMESMRGQVKAGARLLLADLWTDPTYTEPPAASLMSGEFLVISGEGQAYSEQDANGWLQADRLAKRSSASHSPGRPV